MKFDVLDHLSESGDPHNTAKNDDALGFDERVAIVADGATGLWDQRLSNEAEAVSDARWMADLTVKQMLNGRADDPVRDLVLEAINRAREILLGEEGEAGVPRYAYPATGFIMARLQTGLLEISGLGDCVAYVEMNDGYIERFSALGNSSGEEEKSAKADLAARKKKEPGSAIRSPEVMASLRAKRTLQNTPQSGVWTVSLVPEAAEHVMSVALPLGEVRKVLLMSDGFSCAFEQYGIAESEAVFRSVNRMLLSEIQAKIRNVERFEDPDCERFSRYKQSDDSTAILLEIGKQGE